jgi:hypothetical protein
MTSKGNRWRNFIKQHRGQHQSLSQLSVLYRQRFGDVGRPPRTGQCSVKAASSCRRNGCAWVKSTPASGRRSYCRKRPNGQNSTTTCQTARDDGPSPFAWLFTTTCEQKSASPAVAAPARPRPIAVRPRPRPVAVRPRPRPVAVRPRVRPVAVRPRPASRSLSSSFWRRLVNPKPPAAPAAPPQITTNRVQLVLPSGPVRFKARAFVRPWPVGPAGPMRFQAASLPNLELPAPVGAPVRPPLTY